MSKKRCVTKVEDVERAVKAGEENYAAANLVNVIVTGLSQPRARSRTFTAKQCTSCTARRKDDPTVKADDNFTRVFATRGSVRYCRCYYCGNTWKDSDAN